MKQTIQACHASALVYGNFALLERCLPGQGVAKERRRE
jgi:hypothetical protein